MATMTEPATPPSDAPPRRAWWAVLAVLVVLYAAGVTNHWAVSADASLYLGLGRSLAEGRGMAFSGRQWWTIPPGLPLLVAGCRLLTGQNLWLLNGLLSAAAVGAVGVASRTVRRVEGWPTATAVLAAAGLSAYLYTSAARVHTDVLFTLLVAGGVYAFHRAGRESLCWAAPGAALLLLACLTRVVGGLFVVTAVAGLLLARRGAPSRRSLVVAALVAGVAAAAGAVWLFVIRPQADPGVGDYVFQLTQFGARVFYVDYWRDLPRGLWNLPGAVLGAMTGQEPVFWISVGPALLVGWGLVALARRREWVIVLSTVGCIAMLVLLGGGAVSRRYLLPVMPYLVLALLVGAGALGARLARPDPDRARRTGIVVAAAVCAAISLPKVAREIVWLRHPDFWPVYEKGKWEAYPEAAAWLRKHGTPGRDTIAGVDERIFHVLARLDIAPPVPAHILPGHGASRYAAAVAAGSARFVVVPHEPPWTPAIAEALVATGAFAPATEIGDLTIYERRGAAEP